MGASVNQGDQETAGRKTHKNRMAAKMRELLEKLPENEQRVFLKQIRLMKQKG